MSGLFAPNLYVKAQDILALCNRHVTQLATAESCTGGLLSAILTELPGSSRMFTHGFITYANEAKSVMVNVAPALIEQHGAVSEAVARAMAEGALNRSGADLAMAITGIAGPGGATAQKPVGTVHLACAMKGKPTTHQHKVFAGDRSEIRLAAVEGALDIIITALKR